MLLTNYYQSFRRCISIGIVVSFLACYQILVVVEDNGPPAINADNGFLDFMDFLFYCHHYCHHY